MTPSPENGLDVNINNSQRITSVSSRHTNQIAWQGRVPSHRHGISQSPTVHESVRPDIFRQFHENQKPGSDHMAVLTNEHLLVTALLGTCKAMDAPTLVEALTLQNPTNLFGSTERLAPCPEVHEAERVCHAVLLDFDFGKPVHVAYHTSHLVSETGKMILAAGAPKGRVNSIIGLLHSRPDRFEIEPCVIGQPWFDHWRNGRDSATLMALGRDFGEILPEDIDQFSEMTNVKVDSSDEWLRAMRSLPEADVKRAFADLLSEPIKKDWSGEENDHFSANVSVHGRRLTAAFLLKGPSVFREMTLDMCGKRADQILRLTKSGADISIVQNAHLIGSAVRETLRNFTIQPGDSRRKYCLIDGQVTYHILRAYRCI